MKTMFLTSAFDDGFTEEFEEEIKKELEYTQCFTYVASSFEDHEKNVKYAYAFKEKFLEIGIDFEEVFIIDYDVSPEDARNLIECADLIWLAGGDTLQEMYYFDEYHLRDMLADYDGIIVGMSAGSINMADRVVLARDIEDNTPELSIYPGLGLVSINIEPHLDFSREEHIADIEEASEAARIYGLFDNSFIKIKGDEMNIFGDYYIFDKDSREEW